MAHFLQPLQFKSKKRKRGFLSSVTKDSDIKCDVLKKLTQGVAPKHAFNQLKEAFSVL